jgi:hypothetical protein
MDGFDLLEVYIVEEGKDYSDQCNGNKKYSWLNDFKNDIFKKWSASKWNQSMQDTLLDFEWNIKCGHKNYINTEDGDLVKKLNPAIDPPTSMNREKLAFTSGGFNRKPIWTIENIDLSRYKNKNIKIKFKFDTRDTLYNGFRGWIIDDLQVIDKAKLNQ